MNVTVVGPSLRPPESDKGTLHVHKTGCGHLSRLERKYDSDTFFTLDVDDRVDVVTDIYPPRPSFEYDGPDDPDYAIYRYDIHFAPCLKNLPERKEGA